jgi:hypothetical protein
MSHAEVGGFPLDNKNADSLGTMEVFPVLYQGKPVNNDSIGRTLLSIMNEVYVEAKLYNDNITKQDVQAIIGLWELLREDDDMDVEVSYKGMDVSGLMEDID